MNRPTTISCLKTKVSYPATLKAIPIGETRSFKMIGKVYSSMTNAIHRLNHKGFKFSFTTDTIKNILIVTRIA